jgi:hypothetical protein
MKKTHVWDKRNFKVLKGRLKDHFTTVTIEDIRNGKFIPIENKNLTNDYIKRLNRNSKLFKENI